MRSAGHYRAASLALLLLAGGCGTSDERDDAGLAAEAQVDQRAALRQKAAAEASLGKLREQVLEDRVARLENDVAVLMARSGTAGLDLSAQPVGALPADGVLPPLAAAPRESSAAPPPPLPADLSGLIPRAAPAPKAPPEAPRAKAGTKPPRLSYDIGK